MRTSRTKVIGVIAMLIGTTSLGHTQPRYGFGRPATGAEIAGWDLDIRRDGKNLPAGQGSVQQGREIFANQCSGCHGEKGQGGIGDRLVGGQGTLTSAEPVKTVGSFWPYAPTLFDYIRRAMPLNAPQSLTDDEVYAVTAYVLNMNGLVSDGEKLDARSLAAIEMPNKNGFVQDPRPDVHDKRCMDDC